MSRSGIRKTPLLGNELRRNFREFRYARVRRTSFLRERPGLAGSAARRTVLRAPKDE